jgi:hypothetical protein
MERKSLLNHLYQELWLLPLFLYAETHYRFPFFFSLLKKNEPEVIADAPHRLEPRRALPILVLVKDAHLYPAILTQITIEVRQGLRVVQRADYLDQPETLTQRLRTLIFSLDLSSLEGWIDVDVSFTIETNRRTRKYHNDNHRTSSHQPLRVFLARDPLPTFSQLHLGDPHTHSDYTDDQVEFGAPLEASTVLGKAMGLSYFCVTDHSYDLDDHLHSYLTNDPDLVKWQALQSEINRRNEEDRSFVVVRGEEVSCRNVRGENVHFLIFGQREFVHGSGDGAERWLRTRSEYDISEVLHRRSSDSVAFAAHAKEAVPLLQRVLLGRGIWEEPDLEHSGLTGLQIINGMLDDGFRAGYRSWVRQLLRGHRFYAIAGNDAHGNFNRFRQIGIPFLMMKESHQQIFGRMRTGLFLPSNLDERSLLHAFAQGRALMTDGPVARINAPDSDQTLFEIPVSKSIDSVEFDVEAWSTAEFGEITSLQVIVGKTGESTERTALRFDGRQSFRVRKRISLKQSVASYVRLEVWTSEENPFDQQRHFCLTNPVWFGAPS